MPTIPQLQRRTVQTSQQVTRAGVADISGLGRTIGQGIEEVLDARDQYQYDKAASDFSILKQKHDRDFDEDQDFGTMEDRWQEGMDDKFKGILEGISNPTARARFSAQHRPRIEAGRGVIRQRAMGIEKDFERNEVNARMNALKGIVLTGNPKDVQQSVIDGENMVDSAVARGFYGFEEAGELKRIWKQDSAEAFISARDTGEQMQALLDSGIADNLSVEQKIALGKQADAKIVKAKANDMVDALGRDFTKRELYAVSDQIDDDNLRLAVESRGKSVWANQQNANIEEQEDYFQDQYLPVLTGEQTLDPKTPEFLALPSDMQANLLKAESAKHDPPKNSNWRVQDRLNELNARKDYKTLRDVFLNNVHLLDPVDRDKWSKISMTGEVPEEYKSSFTIDQIIQGRLAEFNVTKSKDKWIVRDQINDWRRAKADAGNTPSDREIEDQINVAVSKVQLDPGATWFREEELYYKLDEAEQKKLVENTLTDFNDASDNQLNMVMDNVLDDTVEDKILAQALQAGLAAPARLDESVREKLALRVTDVDPQLSNEIMQEAIKVTGASLNPLQFLEVYERARKSQ